MAHQKHIVIDARIRRASTGRPVDRLIENLQSIDHTHRYTILVEPDDNWQMRAPNFKTMPCPFAQFSFNPLDQIKFARQLYKLKPDLVHFTMTQQPLFYFGRIVTMTHDLTMFSFVRRGTTPLPVYKLKMWLYHFLFWWGHKKSDKIIVPTQTVAGELAEMEPFTKKKIVVTLEASELPHVAKAIKPAGIDGDFIMYHGTAFPHKNLFKLVEAFDILHAERPNLKLVLVGKTEKHYVELEEWAKSRPSYKAIKFMGFVPDAELKWLVENCKAYAYASLSEGFGLTPLEAMEYGAPVAASNVSTMPEVLGSAAHYFNPQSPKDIAAKIADILDDNILRARLVKAGAAQVKKYSWHKMTEETLVVYKAVLHEN